LQEVKVWKAGPGSSELKWKQILQTCIGDALKNAFVVIEEGQNAETLEKRI
jgi:hypothetical protein